MQNITITEGKYYLLDYRKKRVVFKYNGVDMGGNYCFVNASAFYRVSPKLIQGLNPVEVLDPVKAN